MAKQMIADMKTVTTFSFLDREMALSLEIRVRCGFYFNPETAMTNPRRSL